MSSSSSSSGGIGFFGVLMIVFIILKLTGYVNWSWLFIIGFPIITPVVMVLLFFTFFAIIKSL